MSKEEIASLAVGDDVIFVRAFRRSHGGTLCRATVVKINPSSGFISVRRTLKNGGAGGFYISTLRNTSVWRVKDIVPAASVAPPPTVAPTASSQVRPLENYERPFGPVTTRCGTMLELCPSNDGHGTAQLVVDGDSLSKHTVRLDLQDANLLRDALTRFIDGAETKATPVSSSPVDPRRGLPRPLLSQIPLLSAS